LGGEEEIGKKKKKK